MEAAEEDGEESAEELRAASAALQAARGHVSAARLLTKHGLTTSARCDARDEGRAIGASSALQQRAAASPPRPLLLIPPQRRFLPRSAVRDSDRAAALRLVRTLLARLARTRNTESRWVQLWMDLRSITEHGFEQVREVARPLLMQ